MQNSGNSSPATPRPTPRTVTSPTTPTRKRFALAGRSHAFDPRVDAARGDLADLRLADRLFAPHYAAAMTRGVAQRAPVYAAIGGEQRSEVLAGETFDVLELSRGYAWGVSPVDGAAGFVAVDALGPVVAPSHIVIGLGIPDLPMGSRIVDQGFAETDIRPLDAPMEDFVHAAERLVGVPSVPGGRSGAGVDAGGLVFLSLSLAGIRVPRFVDLQATVGRAVGEDAPMLRGDLLFFDGEVAIATDETHAIRVADRVARVPISDLGAISARRRLP
ncbi:C40 family peptidase [Sphingomonas sp. DT-204]|uniref:C40 family peptidase n=1 Tax=Sphingomonas sp. DT-204 TaxID=3396166 RepID=UPI003F1C16EA